MKKLLQLFVLDKCVAGKKYRIASPEKALCYKLYSLHPAKNGAELEALVFEIIGIGRRRFRSLCLDDILRMGEKYHSKNVNLLVEYVLKIMLESTK